MTKYLNPEQILQRLKQKGMSFENEQKAIDFFTGNGYYRFRAYFYNLLDKDNKCQKNGKKFNKPVKFEEIKQIHDFDKTIRNVLFDATQTIELALREYVVLTLSKYGSIGYLDKNNLNKKACDTKKKQNQKTEFKFFKSKLKKLKNNSNAPFTKTKNSLEIWKAVEIMDFGSLINLIIMMVQEDRNNIFTSFGYQEDDELFFTHLKEIGTLRNKCAHHEVLWERKTSKIIIPDKWDVERGQEHSLYNIALIIEHFCKNGVKDKTFWAKNFLFSYKLIGNGIDLQKGYGFPKNWESIDFWENKTKELLRSINKIQQS